MTLDTAAQTAFTQLGTLWHEATAIWLSGGWAMIAIAVTSILMFALGLNVYMRLSGKGFASVPESRWRRWIDRPDERKGPIGEILDFATGGSSLRNTTTCFEELRVTEVAPFERDLRVMKICVGTAPLLGLLGTVTGMLSTFAALATGSGGEKTMAQVAGGISEALVTTETGLVIALAGLFAQYQLARKHERYKTFLTHLETVCIQKLHKTLRTQTPLVGAPALPQGHAEPARAPMLTRDDVTKHAARNQETVLSASDDDRR